jgi:dihydroflavonol-4-reductase
LVWLLAPAAGFKRKMIRLNVGYPWKVDNTKSIRELGMDYIPARDSMVDFFQQMIDNKVFAETKK